MEATELGVSVSACRPDLCSCSLRFSVPVVKKFRILQGGGAQIYESWYQPHDFDPSQVDEATGHAIHALNKEMIAAGVRKFACGLGSGMDSHRGSRSQRL